MKYLLDHFLTDACLAQDYGYSIQADRQKNEKRNEAQNQRRLSKRPHESSEDKLTTVTIQAPAAIHEALRFIATQPVYVVLGVVEELKSMKL